MSDGKQMEFQEQGGDPWKDWSPLMQKEKRLFAQNAVDPFSRLLRSRGAEESTHIHTHIHSSPPRPQNKS
ncbi:hypothetical protein CapIbe_021234 [Capra ibex]